MTTHRWRGDAVPVAQVSTVTPDNVEVGDTFTIAINGKPITVTSTDASVGEVISLMVAALIASTIPEFTEIVATSGGTNVTLTARTPGKPFTVTSSADNASGGTVTIVETTKGVSAVNEVQQVDLIGSYTGGTFTLTFDAQTTGNIAFDATASVVQTALEGLSNIAVGDITVTGGPGPSTSWFVTWKATYAAIEVNEITVDGSLLTGGATVEIETTTTGGGLSDEVQGFNLNATAGTFTLTFNGQTTGNIAFDATASTIQTALEGLPTIGSGNIVVFGGVCTSAITPETRAFYWVFLGSLGGTNVSTVTLDDALLTGGALAPTASIAGGLVIVNEVQHVNLGAATGGTFTLSFNGNATAAIAYDASPNAVEEALEAITGISVGDVAVRLGDNSSSSVAIGGQYGVFFLGSLADTNVSELVLSTGNLTGATSPAVTTMTNGGGGNEIQSVTVYGTGGTFTLTFDGQTTIATAFNASAGTLDTNLTALSSIVSVTVTGAGTVASPFLVEFTDPGDEDVAQMTSDASLLTGGGGISVETTSHGVAVDEIQTVTVDATGGTFTLTFLGVTTGTIAFDAAAATVESALEAISTIDDVTVGGSAGGPWTVTFDSAALGGRDVALMTGDPALLSGGSSSETFITATPTGSEGPNHWDTARNWSGNAVPVNADTVFIDQGDVGIWYGLDQSAVTLTKMEVGPDYSGTIGLPEINNTNSVQYFEYRDRQLQVGATLCNIIGGGGLVRIDFGATQTEANVDDTGTAIDEDVPALLLSGTNASNVISISKGSVGLAFYPDELLVAPTLNIGHDGNIDGDVTCVGGEGCTFTTINKTGGDFTFETACTTFIQDAGTTNFDETAALTTLTVRGGEFVYNSTGALGTGTVSGDGHINFSLDNRAKTVTNPIERYGADSKISDPYQVVASLEVDNNETGDLSGLDLGINIRITRGTPA